MKNLILLFIILTLFLRCEKEPQKIFIVSVMDTIEENYWIDIYDSPYFLDVNEDNINDIRFDLDDSFGSSGCYSSSLLTGLNNTQIAFSQEYDTTWTDWGILDTIIWNYINYKQVRALSLHDTICRDMETSNEELIITEFSDPYCNFGAPGDYTPLRLDNLLYGVWYIGIIPEKGLAWVKIEVLGFSKLVIHEFGYTKELDQFIITEK